MRFRSKKEDAFSTLSLPAQLHIKIEEATTDQEKFIEYIRYATDIAERKSYVKIDELTNTNLAIIMQFIQSYLEAGIDLNAVEKKNAGLFQALTYPELIKLLLAYGADPTIRNDPFQQTPLHWVAMFFHSIYTENLLKTAEILVAAGANIDTKDSEGKKPVDLIKDTFLLSKNKINEIEARFKQVTEHPRQLHEIPTQSIVPSSYSTLQLTGTDRMKIALYKEKKYDALIKLSPLHRCLQSLFGARRRNPGIDFDLSFKSLVDLDMKPGVHKNNYVESMITETAPSIVKKY